MSKSQMNKMPIYLDYMATAPIDPQVIAKMLEYMGPTAHYGNAASKTHIYGKEAAVAVEESRARIAECIKAAPEEVIFTSGATEADNLAIIGAARFYQRKGRHLITMATEHKAVLDSFKELEREGFTVSYLKPAQNGLLDLEKLEHALREDTILVSIMQINNEIGVIQDINAIAALLKGRGILFHVDAAQSAGKLAIDLSNGGPDMMSFSAHKMYGPKGVGALYVRHKPRVRLMPLSFGGGHEGGLRSGTLATHQIVGMAEAFCLSEKLRETEQRRLLQMRNQLWQSIQDLPGIRLNGDAKQRVASNLNFSFQGIDGEKLLLALNGLALSSTSACTSNSTESSHVLRAIGLSDDLARSTVRLSLGRYTTKEELPEIISIIRQGILQLQAQSTLN